MHLFRTWSLALLGCALLPLYGMACDCGYAGAPCKAFANTPTVFVGRVVKISTIERKTLSGDKFKDRLVSFDVERSYRGWTSRTAEVVTGWGGGDCGYAFQEGVRYLVYAFPHPEVGKLYTGICQRTRLLSEGSEDLEYLNKKDDPSHGSGIEGMIEVLDANRIHLASFLGGVPVLIEGPSGRQTVLSQKDGRFRLWGILPGRYRVTPVLPKSFLPDKRTVKLKRNSCAELFFLAAARPRGNHAPQTEDKWHKVFQGRLAEVDVARTVYESGKNEDCFIAVRVTNIENRPIGVDLRKFWNVVYPNSWGFSKTPSPRLIEEERIIRQPISAADKKKLLLDYASKRFTRIMPNSSLTYFRAFTVGHDIKKEVDSAGAPYLIIGLDGALELTDGDTIEEVMFRQNDRVADDRRWVVIQLPVHWQTVSQPSFVVEEHP